MPVLELPDVRLNYICLGPSEPVGGGEPFVLIHGLASSLAFWYFRIAPGLARRHRVVMLDLRGHGRSSMPRAGYAGAPMAADVHALLDHLSIERAHLVGHSFGGNVALHFACHYPERTGRLTLADVRVRSLQPAVDLQSWPLWPRYRSLLEQAGIEIDAAAKEIGFEMFERFARLRLSNPAELQHLDPLAVSPFSGAGGDPAARRWLEMLETTGIRHELADTVAVRPADLEPLSMPTLLAYGEYSHCLPTAHQLLRRLRGSRLEIVPGAGHFFPAKYPERLVEHMLTFVSEGCVSA
jgi:pimeloyl-ACP methyl ester carboxylesterase